MQGLDVVRQVSSPARRLEDHAEVQALPGIDHVQNALGVQGSDPVADRGQVGGSVAEAAVALLDDQRGRSPVRPEDVVEEHAQRPVAAHRDAPLLQVGADLLEEKVVEALADRVLVGEQDPEPFVDGLEVDLGLGHDVLPPGDRLRVSGLERHHPLPRPVGEFRVAVELLPGSPVKRVQPGDGLLAGLALADGELALRFLLHELDQHPELRAPVTDVVVPDDLGSVELQDPHQRVPDNSAAQVADVHLLGDVRLRVVDDRDGAGIGCRNAEPRVAAPAVQLLPDRLVGNGEVKEARTRHLAVRDQVIVSQPGSDLRRQLARVRPQGLGQRQHAVGLKVGVVGGSDLGVRLCGIDGQGGGHRLPYPLVKCRCKRRHRVHRDPCHFLSGATAADAKGSPSILPDPGKRFTRPHRRGDQPPGSGSSAWRSAVVSFRSPRKAPMIRSRIGWSSDPPGADRHDSCS